MSGVGVFADGAALETYFSAQKLKKSPESPHVWGTFHKYIIYLFI